MAIPWLEGKTIENCPKIHGIATPVCALVRNDRSIGRAINCNFPFYVQFHKNRLHFRAYFVMIIKLEIECMEVIPCLILFVLPQRCPR